MQSEINKLIIVGNGFDLAHGLRTNYEHFINHYLSKIFKHVMIHKSFKDPLTEVSSSHPRRYNGSFELTSKEVLETLKALGYTFKTGKFLTGLINISLDKNWVDIEYNYFEKLKQLYIKKASNEEIEYLNIELNLIKNLLVEYLNLENEKVRAHDLLWNSYHDFFEPKGNTRFRMNTYILNFNYTDTVSKYIKPEWYPWVEENKIHGCLSDSNSIIFGYGDEKDPFYLEMENRNLNSFMKYMKSFGYLKSKKYIELSNFINTREFDVHILGHSMGVSDRTLFKEIFESDFLRHIKIHYHLKEDGSNDFEERTFELSRHFDNKVKFRKKIDSLENCLEMIQHPIYDNQHEIISRN